MPYSSSYFLSARVAWPPREIRAIMLSADLHLGQRFLASYFPHVRFLDHHPICLLHPFLTPLLYLVSNTSPSAIDSYFQPFYVFHSLLVREFILISLVSARDQAFWASSLIVSVAILPVKPLPPSLVLTHTYSLKPLLIGFSWVAQEEGWQSGTQGLTCKWWSMRHSEWRSKLRPSGGGTVRCNKCR